MGLRDLAAWWENVKTVRNPMRRELALFELLTGLRMTDARKSSEQHLDETAKTLFIPKPKGGRRRAFTLPLSDAAIGCIHRARALPRRKPSDLLFPNTDIGESKRRKH